MHQPGDTGMSVIESAESRPRSAHGTLAKPNEWPLTHPDRLVHDGVRDHCLVELPDLLPKLGAPGSSRWRAPSMPVPYNRSSPTVPFLRQLIEPRSSSSRTWPQKHMITCDVSEHRGPSPAVRARLHDLDQRPARLRHSAVR